MKELQPSPCGFCGRLIRWFDPEEAAKHEYGACQRPPAAKETDELNEKAVREAAA